MTVENSLLVEGNFPNVIEIILFYNELKRGVGRKWSIMPHLCQSTAEVSVRIESFAVCHYILSWTEGFQER